MAEKITHAMHEALQAVNSGEMNVAQAAVHFDIWPNSIYRQLRKAQPRCPTCGQVVRRVVAREPGA